MKQFMINLVAVLSSLMTIATGLGLSISPSIGQALHVTNVSLWWLFGISFVLAYTSIGIGQKQRANISKKQIQIGGSGNKQHMG